MANSFFRVFVFCMRISSLNYPPIKNNLKRHIPKELVYKFDRNKDFSVYRMFSADTYIMFSTDKNSPTTISKMICSPSRISYNLISSKSFPSLYIYEIKSFPKGKGLGRKMLNYAKFISRQKKCGGRFHLSADGCFSPNCVPHLFYRKFGMNTGMKDIDDKMDLYIKKGLPATQKDFSQIDMYYPPIEYKENKFMDKVRRFFV